MSPARGWRTSAQTRARGTSAQIEHTEGVGASGASARVAEERNKTPSPRPTSRRTRHPPRVRRQGQGRPPSLKTSAEAARPREAVSFWGARRHSGNMLDGAGAQQRGITLVRQIGRIHQYLGTAGQIQLFFCLGCWSKSIQTFKSNSCINSLRVKFESSVVPLRLMEHRCMIQRRSPSVVFLLGIETQIHWFAIILPLKLSLNFNHQSSLICSTFNYLHNMLGVAIKPRS
mmetsp:Transcript_47193/g.125415  ORF Transcript_47193/g.125415 Transcript_47193/m.125415 type:complete len:230 (-) Transcript_47193:251-940(-)